MANKKKNSPKQSNINQKEAELSKPINLLYMTPSEVKAKNIAELLTEVNGISIEIWDEMNVLEITLANQNSVDFEPLDLHFQNASDAAFVKNRNIKTIYAISIVETDLELIKPVFERIINQYSGFLCSDTEDFQPIYIGSIDR